MDPDVEHKLDLLTQALRDKYLVAEFHFTVTELMLLCSEIPEEQLKDKDFPSADEWEHEKREFDERVSEWMGNLSDSGIVRREESLFPETSGLGKAASAVAQEESDLVSLFKDNVSIKTKVSFSSSTTSRATIKRQMRFHVNRELAKLQLHQTAERLEEEEKIARLERERDEARARLDCEKERLEREKERLEQDRKEENDKLRRQQELRAAEHKVELADVELQAWERASNVGSEPILRSPRGSVDSDVVRKPASVHDVNTDKMTPQGPGALSDSTVSQEPCGSEDADVGRTAMLQYRGSRSYNFARVATASTRVRTPEAWSTSYRPDWSTIPTPALPPTQQGRTLAPRRHAVSFKNAPQPGTPSQDLPARTDRPRGAAGQGRRISSEPVQLSCGNDSTTADLHSTPASQVVHHHHHHASSAYDRTLPHPVIAKFEGRPRKYHSFVKSFDSHIAPKVSNDDLRLVYLLQHCADHVKTKLEHFTKKSNGYLLARAKLYERYGQPHVIADACEAALKSFPAVRQTKPDDLSAYADLLDECLTTLSDIGEFASVNTLETIMLLVSKLPQKIRDDWPKYALEVQATTGVVAKFPDFVAFVQQKSDEYNSLYGKKLNEMYVRNHPPPPRRSKAFANTIDADSSKAPTKEESNNAVCLYCDGPHDLAHCGKFSRKIYEEIVKFLRDKRLCFKCLSPNHIAAKCEKEICCSVKGCKGKRHHTLLHRNSVVPKKEPAPNSTTPDAKALTCTLSRPLVSEEDPQNAYLCVVPVKIVHESKVVHTYAFVVSGSTASLVSNKLINLLGLSGAKRRITLRTIGSRPVQYDGISVDKITVMPLNGSRKIHMQDVLSVDKVPATPNVTPDRETLRKMRHLRGIDFPKIEGGTVNLLIGADMPEVCCFEKFRKSRRDGPCAVKTALGWSLFGPSRTKSRLEVTSDNKSVSCSLQVNHISVDQELVQREIDCLWKTDFGDGTSVFDTPTSREDRLAYETMQNSVKYVDGHFQLPLLWKPGMRNALCNNLSMANNRSTPLKKRMLRDKDYRARYTGAVETYIVNGHAVQMLVEEVAAGSPIWYLPHFSVINPRKPDKLRVVFDAAAKFLNLSLNDCLMQGPDLVCTLIGVLLRFRKGKIPLVADIEAMFHQIRVAPGDQDALRFLYWPNGNLSTPPVPHRMLVHLFGSKSSPACATFCLKHTASVFGSEFDPHISEIVRRSFYVDDCLATVETVEEAIDTVEQLTKLLAKGGFHLTKWLTNDNAVLSTIPQSERAKKIQNHEIDDSVAERVLGVHWNVAVDQFGFSVNVPEKPLTRRGVLSAVASLFDPLGLVAPAVLPAKLLLQGLCRKNLDWDEPMDKEDIATWREWLLQLPHLEKVKIDRCFRPQDFGTVTSVQLHHFADASTVAYSAVSYLRIVDQNQKIHCTFLFGKSRLAPIKSISISRVELTAAVLAVRLDGMLRKELDLEECSSTFWSDSTAIIHSIRNSTKRFPTFFANRLAQIDRGSDPSQWRYVPSKLNPADVGSRGTDASSISSSSWLSGPDYLLEPESQWPKDSTSTNLSEELVPSDSVGSDTLVNAIGKDSVKGEMPQSSAKSRNDILAPNFDMFSVMNKFVESFSKLHRLKTAAVWMIRFKDYLRSHVENKLQMGLGQSCRNFSGF